MPRRSSAAERLDQSVEAVAPPEAKIKAVPEKKGPSFADFVTADKEKKGSDRATLTSLMEQYEKTMRDSVTLKTDQERTLAKLQAHDLAQEFEAVADRIPLEAAKWKAKLGKIKADFEAFNPAEHEFFNKSQEAIHEEEGAREELASETFAGTTTVGKKVKARRVRKEQSARADDREAALQTLEKLQPAEERVAERKMEAKQAALSIDEILNAAHKRDAEGVPFTAKQLKELRSEVDDLRDQVKDERKVRGFFRKFLGLGLPSAARLRQSEVQLEAWEETADDVLNKERQARKKTARMPRVSGR